MRACSASISSVAGRMSVPFFGICLGLQCAVINVSSRSGKGMRCMVAKIPVAQLSARALWGVMD